MAKLRSPTPTAAATGVSPSTSPLRIHCLGTLQVAHAGEPVDRFESQKVRALFAYLACHLGNALSRDHLAALFWPEKDENSARRNLRQALYNIRSLFPKEESPLIASRQHVQVNPAMDCWVDVVAFEDAIASSGSEDRLDPHRLTEAVGLYRGHFLSGFQVKDSEEFEYWLQARQDQLREKVATALRLLIDSYVERGEYRLGIQYAQRLVGVEPLSEDAHQQLMRLYSLSGRRNRALAQYEQLVSTLRRELDVEPLEQTAALQRRILLQGSAPSDQVSGEDSTPLIPMAGRDAQYDQLESCMQQALRGEGLLTLIEGEAGIGKTRLIRSFLDAASSSENTLVLSGGCLDVLPGVYQPIARALRGHLAEGSELAEDLARYLDADTLADLSLIAPGLAPLVPSGKTRRRSSPARQRERVFEAIARAFVALCGVPGAASRRVLVLLGEMESADPAALELLDFLSSRLRAFPVWIALTAEREELAKDHPLHRLVTSALDQENQISLSRLDSQAIYQIASGVVPLDQAEELASFLERSSAGLPQALTQGLNFLRDGGLIHPESGRWSLGETSLADLALSMRDIRGLIVKRFKHLPYSARRLAALAAVAGSRFEANLLAEAADEHIVVCEIGFDIMLQRWLIRRSADQWRGREDVLEEGQTQEAYFEFSSQAIWETIYRHINPARRRIMHREIAELIERSHRDDPIPVAELLARHFREARLHEEAQAYLSLAATKAEHCGAIETALLYWQLAMEEVNARLSRAKRDEIPAMETELAELRERCDRLQPVLPVT